MSKVNICEIEKKAKDAGLNVVSVLNVWSNGKKIRRYVGQGKDSLWHNPRDGYRKMVAILVEEEKGRMS